MLFIFHTTPLSNLLFGPFHGSAEVDEFGLLGLDVDEDVFVLDVAVKNASFVKTLLHRRRQLPEYLPSHLKVVERM